MAMTYAVATASIVSLSWCNGYAAATRYCVPKILTFSAAMR